MFTVGMCRDILRSIYVGGGGRIRMTSSRGKLLRRLTHLRLLCGQSMPTSSKPYPENSILIIFSANKCVTCQLACVVTCQTVYMSVDMYVYSWRARWHFKRYICRWLRQDPNYKQPGQASSAFDPPEAAINPYPEISILIIVSANKFVTCQLACVVTCQKAYVGGRRYAGRRWYRRGAWLRSAV